MAGAPPAQAAPSGSVAPARGHPAWRRLLIAGTVVFLSLFILLPVANVFTQALSKGVDGYVAVFTGATTAGPVPTGLVERRKFAAKRAQSQKTWSAIRMSAGVAAFVVPLNIGFGLVAAWAVTKFRFRGRLLLVALIDLPFSVSPVVAGLIFVLLYGRTGLFGSWATNWQWPDPTSLTWVGFAGGWPLAFTAWNTGVIFTPLAIGLASLFVTFPFVARSVIPLMEAQGTDEEVAALSLGARGWRTFRTVTLPNIRWALLYGVILCTARVFGEFGAVSVVSGNTDANDTMPLRIEKLWNEYDNQAAFTVASLLVGLALFTLVLKALIDLRTTRTEQMRDTQAPLQTGRPL
ncbi:ABC transporter permease subunit [Lichenihabitans sp. Uapishka_5]|uniref:sulfate ABC transporter permease n=1 Tax=Lichenihabitans sp. Uapishka_5 TaxID=3037302 RepID=UPI0029E80EAE|nr:ABC transporter permease subunit [Lichenihabitans sp. Uapishka_5]MDX7952919.1 ABC transporter permease subunit [Lichenihabitans sp. Uapishka_5]